MITQKDINYVLDSKATVQGGVKTLMKKLGISQYDVKNVYLAGAFGTYASVENMKKLGIFPAFPNAKFHNIGNGSLNGAYMALISLEKRREAEKIANSMTYLELLTDLDFMEFYQSAMYIPGF